MAQGAHDDEAMKDLMRCSDVVKCTWEPALWELGLYNVSLVSLSEATVQRQLSTLNTDKGADLPQEKTPQ
jgi:hypothetical protein